MIDIRNNFLIIPPFRDAHVHLMIDGHQANLDDCRFITDQFLAKGIVSVADMGHKSGLGLEFKKIIDEKNVYPLKMRSAGFALFKKGTYGGFLGKGVSGKKEIQAAIKALIKAGADFIKVINSGIVFFRKENSVTEGGFSEEEWKVIREETGRQGIKIRCHANTDQAIRQAVTFGASSIEHGFFVSQETLHMMLERSVYWTPTVFAPLSTKAFLPEKEQGQLEKIVNHHLMIVSYAASIGVHLQVGTDSGSRGIRPGESFFKELQLFKKAGLSLDQIVSAACLDREELKRGNYVLVEKKFIVHEKVEAVILDGIPTKNNSIGSRLVRPRR